MKRFPCNSRELISYINELSLVSRGMRAVVLIVRSLALSISVGMETRELFCRSQEHMIIMADKTKRMFFIGTERV